MNIQKPTITEAAIIGAVVIGGFLAWRAWRAMPKTLDQAIDRAATAVDQRQNQDSALGGVQSWFADTVQKGQDAGASNFVTSFFTGLTK